MECHAAVFYCIGNFDEIANKIKIIWGAILSLMAIVLLFSGGLVAMRNTSIIMALPFLIIIILMCVAIYKAFANENSG